MSTKNNKHLFLASITALVLFCSFFIQPALAQEQPNNTETTPIPQSEFFQAVLISEPTEETVTEFGTTSFIQYVSVKLIEGPDTGKEFELKFSIPGGSPKNAKLKVNDRVILTQNIYNEYYIIDVYRLNSLWLLLGSFIFLVLFVARWAGLRSLLGLLLSFSVIIWFIIPQIINGQNALFVGFTGTLIIATASIFVAHGFRSRTTIAFVSTVITILGALLIAMFFTDLMHLFGLGNEEAFFLQTTPDKILNLRGILLAGIVIGTLGVLDDITTAQAAVVEELHKAKPSFSIRELFIRGSSVGQEHIISLVNTLILAYTGAALPLLLLFKINEGLQPI